MTHDETKRIFDLVGFETSDKNLLQIFCDFASVVQDDEREACANICDLQMEISEINKYIAIGAGNCADAIRARGQG